MHRILRVITTLILVGSPLFSQQTSTGRIGGTVYDERSGEALIGATVVVQGTTNGAATDLDGKFLIQGLAPGLHSVRVSFVGYTSKVVTEIAVTAEGTSKLDVMLTEESIEAPEVVVTARAIRSSEASILSQRRQSASIGDGISAEMIKRAPDATSADALKRVVGVSIMDNKYVLVRGVSDRYNQTTLNGATMNSTDTQSDKRSFTFDMIPSNLLDNTVVVKTATPDKPGDFTGGLVELKTMDFPDQTVLKVSIGTSTNSLTTGRSINTSRGGATDWLGSDDGSRRAPDAQTDGFAKWKDLNNSWANSSVRAPINQSLSLAYGDRLLFDGFDIGLVAALSYKGGYARSESDQDFTTGSGDFIFSGTKDSYSMLIGGISDVSVKFGEGAHKLSIHNAYNRTADDEVQVMSGIDFQGREIRSSATQWTERSIYNGQLAGDHSIPWLANSSLAWKWFYSESDASEPDRRRLKYQRQFGDDQPFSIAGTENNERAWTHLDERTRGGSFDLSVPVSSLTMKLGGAFESGDRNYGIVFTSAEFLGNDYSATFLPPDSIFLPSAFNSDGWIVRTLSDAKDTYLADRRIGAAYLMADAPFEVLGERFRVVGGARWEDARLRAFTYMPAFISGVSTFREDTTELRNKDLLPSVNLTYIVNDRMNVRLAFSNSVNRPELREIANITYYDFINYEEHRGNPNLKRAWVDNYDVRFEVYPEIGEILAVSGFYKKIYDAIEQRVVWSSNPGKEWINTPQAENYGWEIEMRKSFSFVDTWLERLVITSNYSRIISNVQFREVRIIGLDSNFVPIKETFTDVRSMQGQASYTLNAGLHFTEPDWGTSVSVMFNKFGRRVEAVADIRDEDIFEEARGTIDISLTQKIMSNLDVKFTGRDITAEPRMYTLRNGDTFKNLRTGSTYGLQLSWAL